LDPKPFGQPLARVATQHVSDQPYSFRKAHRLLSVREHDRGNPLGKNLPAAVAVPATKSSRLDPNFDPGSMPKQIS
jgi:hypothetical protein